MAYGNCTGRTSIVNYAYHAQRKKPVNYGNKHGGGNSAGRLAAASNMKVLRRNAPMEAKKFRTKAKKLFGKVTSDGYMLHTSK